MGISPAIVEQSKTMIPLGRPGNTEEAAGAVYLFCIPESDYVSGQVLVCGGGIGNV
ncbi:oxidoreductase [compost metagenome]